MLTTSIDSRFVTGVEVVGIPKFAAMLDHGGPSGCHDVFTVGELADCLGCVPRLAARFAAKQAAAKTLGIGIGQIGWRSVEVRNDQDGRTRLRLTGPAASLAKQRGFTHWAISLSHTDQTAIAIAVADTSSDPEAT